MSRFASLVMLLLAACTFDTNNQVSGDGEVPNGQTPLIDGSVVDARTEVALDAQSDAQISEDCVGTLVDFEQGLDLGFFPDVGVYSGLDFDDAWTAYAVGQYNAASASITFSNNRRSGEFWFEDDDARILRSLRVTWSGFDATVTISDPDNPANAPVVVHVDEVTRSVFVPTNWMVASSTVVVDSTANWQFYLDDICHDAP